MAETYGYGARAIGMGGAFVGHAEGISALFYNPAGLARSSGHHASFGYLLGLPDLRVDGPGGARELRVDGKLHAPYLGIVADLSRAFHLDRRIVFGLAGVFPGNFKNAYQARYGTDFDPYLPLFGVGHEDQRISLWLGPAVEIFPWLYLGGGCAFIVHGEEVDIRVGIDALTGEIVTDRSRVSMHVSTEIAPMAGILIKPGERWSIGATWRKELAFEAPTQGATLTTILPGGIEAPLNIVLPLRAHCTPAQYALGVAFRPLDRLLLSADVTYMDWSPYTLNDGGPIDPPMKDRWVPRVGLELDLADRFAVRAGYAYQPSPLPRQQTGFRTNLLDSSRHILAVGSGYALEWPAVLNHPLAIEAFVQFQYLEPRLFPNVHPGGPDLRVRGHILAVGAEIGFRF